MSHENEMRELDSMLSKHDWYYAFSDDNSVYKRGEAAGKEIAKKLAEINHKDANRLYKAYLDIYFSPARGFTYVYD